MYVGVGVCQRECACVLKRVCVACFITDLETSIVIFCICRFACMIFCKCIYSESVYIKLKRMRVCMCVIFVEY